jgi:hypothetical protein
MRPQSQSHQQASLLLLLLLGVCPAVASAGSPAAAHHRLHRNPEAGAPLLLSSPDLQAEMDRSLAAAAHHHLAMHHPQQTSDLQG